MQLLLDLGDFLKGFSLEVFLFLGFSLLLEYISVILGYLRPFVGRILMIFGGGWARGGACRRIPGSQILGALGFWGNLW